MEHGIGETRAALVEDGRIVRAEVERDGALRVGTVARARFAATLAGRRAVLATFEDGAEVMVDSPPRQVGPGARFTVRIVREAITGPRRAKKAKAVVVADDEPLGTGPSLHDRLAADGTPVRTLHAFGPDLLEVAGWSELMEEARSGVVTFPGGTLLIEMTEGMTVIDVDGTLDPAPLAVAGARAAAEAIGRLRLGGSVGIDLPTTDNRAARQAAADAFDAAMQVPFERTAVNGFGFMQAIVPRPRASLMELIAGDQALAEALLLYRRAEREPPPGALVIRAGPTVALAARAEHDAALSARAGAPVRWQPDPSLTIWQGSAFRTLDETRS